MMTHALSLLESTVSWIWTASWQATLIAGLVLLTQWVLRRRLSARWRNALWLLVFARLLMPTLPASRCSAYNWLPVRRDIAAAHFRNVPEVNEAAAVEAELPTVSRPNIPQPPLAAPKGVQTRGQNWRLDTLLSFTWGIGFVAALGLGAAGYLRLRRRAIRSQRDIPESLKEQFQAAKAELRVNHADLMVSEAVSTPMVTGLWRARIILPPDIESTLSPEDVRMVLLHELARVRRGDLWMAWLAWIAGALHWFNPAIHYVAGRARKDREMACDEWVLRAVTNSNAYGLALVHFLEYRQSARPRLGTIGIFESKAALVQRVKRIADYRRPTVWGALAGVWILMTIGVLTLTGASTPKLGNAKDTATAKKTEPIEYAAAPFVVQCEDGRGHAVPGAEVYLIQWHSLDHDQFSATGPLRTDAGGKAVFSKPITFHHGEYSRLVYARVPGKLVAGRFVMRNVTNNRDDGAEKQITLKMRPSTSLKGTVKLAGGKDPRLAKVSLMWSEKGDPDNGFGGDFSPFQQPEPWPQLVERKPDRNGAFEFEDIARESIVYLLANAAGFGETQWMKLLPVAGNEFPTLLLEPESIIEGRVRFSETNRPAAGIHVWAQQNHGGYVQHPFFATTLDDGSFKIGGLGEGTYDVSAGQSTEWTAFPQSVMVRPGVSGSANLVLEPGMLMTGKVTEKGSDMPVKGIGITADANEIGGQALDTAVSDGNGNYRLRLPSGKSLLFISDFQNGDFENPKDQARRTVTIAGGKITDGSPDFVLTRKESPAPSVPPKNATVRGRVIDSDGRPVPNVLVSYDTQPLPQYPTAPGNQEGGPLGSTKEDGTYEFKLHPFCNYEIRAGGVFHSTARSRRFETGSGTWHQVEDLVIHPATGSASGVVVDQDGRPLANVEIEPSSKNKFAWTSNQVRSDEAGHFAIFHLLADELFDLRLHKPGYTPRNLYRIPPNTADLQIQLLRETQPMPGIKYGGEWLRDGKRLIGRPAPDWNVQEWIQKQDSSPGPKRSDGRWTLLWFDRGEDGSGEYIQKLAEAARRFNLVPVVIYQSHFDAHLPRWILQKTPLPVTVGVDRYTNDPTDDPQQSEYSVTRIAYGNRNAYLIDPDGIVRSTPNNNLEGIGSVMGKPDITPVPTATPKTQ
ncbi:MAG: M56 family metallopeptidase [Chthoniobacteraceae bacterium]